MVIQRRYVKIFKILENDPQGKAILYKAFADTGRTDEDRDFTLNADAGIILNGAQISRQSTMCISGNRCRTNCGKSSRHSMS